MRKHDPKVTPPHMIVNSHETRLYRKHYFTLFFDTIRRLWLAKRVFRRENSTGRSRNRFIVFKINFSLTSSDRTPHVSFYKNSIVYHRQ